jgi:Transposase IS4
VYNGLVWKHISIDEMHRFMGVMLRMSMTKIDSGGYPAYFSPDDEDAEYDSDTDVENEKIIGSRGFVSMVPDEFRMSLNRYKQIRGAFHPEDKALGNGSEDKSYMLRNAMSELNEASLAVYVPERALSFDEGGSACRSRRCPIRQYNKDKPDKYRVDFFILAGAESRVIYHIDVYQGRNDFNVGIAPEFKNLPTTMKAVLNAVSKSGISSGSNDVNGYRIVALDNRYQCPQLAYLLWHK